MFRAIHFEWHEAVAASLVAFVCVMMLSFRNGWWHARTVRDIHQVHSTHINPTPRLGGVAILSACLLLILFHDGYFADRYVTFVISVTPLAVVCLWEDMIRQTHYSLRLLATVVSITLSIALLDVHLSRIGISEIDPWMGGAFGVAMTIAYITAAVNGMNMIDGLNGLAGLYSASALAAMSILAGMVDYHFMAHISMTLAVSIASFLFFNFPVARLFLGDTGTYLIGYILGWFSISIINRESDVSPLALFLILVYPLFEVVFTFARRTVSHNSPFGADKLHLHHMILRLVEDVRGSVSEKSHWNNPIATLLTTPPAIGPMFYAVSFYNDTFALLIGVLSYGVINSTLYYFLWRRYAQ